MGVREDALAHLIEPGVGVMGYFARFDDVLINAFNEWCRASSGNISMTRASTIKIKPTFLRVGQ